MKQVIKLNETYIRKIVNKTVRRVICEQKVLNEGLYDSFKNAFYSENRIEYNNLSPEYKFAYDNEEYANGGIRASKDFMDNLDNFFKKIENFLRPNINNMKSEVNQYIYEYENYFNKYGSKSKFDKIFLGDEFASLVYDITIDLTKKIKSIYRDIHTPDYEATYKRKFFEQYDKKNHTNKMRQVDQYRDISNNQYKYLYGYYNIINAIEEYLPKYEKISKYTIEKILNYHFEDIDTEEYIEILKKRPTYYLNVFKGYFIPTLKNYVSQFKQLIPIDLIYNKNYHTL